ncbi:hypothetical protein RFI_09326, partial [Reticulomyxa filosa]
MYIFMVYINLICWIHDVLLLLLLFVGVFSGRLSANKKKLLSKRNRHVQGDCICYRSEAFDLLNTYTIRLNEVLEPKQDDTLIDESVLRDNFGVDLQQWKAQCVRNNEGNKVTTANKPVVSDTSNTTALQESFFYKLHRRSPDIVVVLHLKHKQTQRQMIACTSHFYWNPKYPHIKSLQCYLFSKALDHLLTKKWNLITDNIPIVIGLDANALAHKDTADRFDPQLPQGYFIH